jgi:hypothetical protein
VAEIDGGELVEKGHYIDEDANNFWGVQVFEDNGQEYVAASDRDHGLWIFKFQRVAGRSGFGRRPPGSRPPTPRIRRVVRRACSPGALHDVGFGLGGRLPIRRRRVAVSRGQRGRRSPARAPLSRDCTGLGPAIPDYDRGRDGCSDLTCELVEVAETSSPRHRLLGRQVIPEADNHGADDDLAAGALSGGLEAERPVCRTGTAARHWHGGQQHAREQHPRDQAAKLPRPSPSRPPSQFDLPLAGLP